MKNHKSLAFLLLIAWWLLPQMSTVNGRLSTARAQSAGTVSSYSRFGLGVLRDQSQGFNRSMGGAGLGLRIGNRINVVNPASYSAIDSLSLILDVGMSGSFGKMVQGNITKGVKNASVDYAHIGMHVAKRLGLAVGFMPYTSIGYDFDSPETVLAYDPLTTEAITGLNGYSGSGGLNQAYVGLGWRAIGRLSVGANVSLLWGKYSHTLIPVYMEGGVLASTYSNVIKMYYASLKTYKLDFGVQYPVRLTAQDWLNLGATASIGHKLAQDASLSIATTKGDTATYTASKPFDIPYAMAFGAAWQHKNTLLVAADVHQEFWSKCRLPMETTGGYEAMKGGYKDRTVVAVGAQWTPDPFDKKYWRRIQYRAGVNFSTPYLKVNGSDGPSELRLSMGAGLPITNRINNRSVVNFGVEWLRRSASGTGMIKEDYFVLNLGITFNERWFMRYKIE